MIIRCCCCGKQAISGHVSAYDKYCTIMEGSRPGFNDTVFCGYCAKDMDQYGLFPEERCLLTEDEVFQMYGEIIK